MNLLDADDLPATQEALVAAFVPNGEREVVAALKQLTSAGLVFRRGPTGSYRLWPHSSVNLEGAFQTASRVIGSLDSVADSLLPFLDREPLLARRHYVESGTMRYFEVRYAKVDALAQAMAKSTDADGLLVIALPDSDADRSAAFEASTSPPFSARSDVVLGIPRPLRSLAVELQELKRWRWVAENRRPSSGGKDLFAPAELDTVRIPEPQQKPTHRPGGIDPLVNPGSSTHRHQTRSKANPTRSHHRMVTLA